MADLKDTSRQLSDIRNKLIYLNTVIKDYKSVDLDKKFDDNEQIAAASTNINIMNKNLSLLSGNWKSLNKQMKGIGSTGESFDKVSSAVQKLRGNVDILIKQVQQYSSLTNKAMPTTLKQDTAESFAINGQKIVDAYNKQYDALVSNIRDKFSKKQDMLSKIDTSKVDTKQLDQITDTLKSSLDLSADIETINRIWEKYNEELNKVIETVNRLKDAEDTAHKKLNQTKATKASNIQKTEDLKAAFDKRQAEIQNIDMSKFGRIKDQVKYWGSALARAFDHGANITKLTNLWNVYINVTNKVIGRVKAREIAEQRAADAATAAAKKQAAADKQQAAEDKQAAIKQDALNKKWSEFKVTRQKTQDLRSAFEQRQDEIQNLDTTGLDRLTARADIARAALKSAFGHGDDINKLMQLWEVYIRETDKVIGHVKARELAEQQAAAAATEAIRQQAVAAEAAAADEQAAIAKRLDDVRNYIQKREILEGKKIQPRDQVAYYDQQLSKFAEGSDEYLEVLRLKRNAEAQAAAATKNAWNSIFGSIKSAADAINGAVNKIISIIRGLIQIYQKLGTVVAGVFKALKKSVSTILTLFSNFGNRLKSLFTGGADSATKFNKSFGLIGGTATELRSKLLLVQGALNQIFNNELINKAKKLLSQVYQLKTMTGPDVTQGVIDWANSMEHAFGLSARGLISDLSELSGVLYGLGMSGDDVAVGSENLLIMARYLSNMGAAGGDLDTVMSKIISGMKGMTAQIDDLGLSVRDAQMNAFLKNLKSQGGEFADISTDFQNLNEQARVYVRYAALIDQFTKNYDVTRLVDSLNTITGRLSTLKDTWKSLTITVGTGLTKLAQMAATYIIPVIKLIENKITQLFVWIERTLGLASGSLSTDLTPTINDNASDAVDAYNKSLDTTADKLDAINKSQKKAQGGLQSFDRVNNVTTSKSSGKSQGADDFDYSKLMTSMLGKLNDMAAEANESFFESLNKNLETKLADIKNKVMDFARDITGRTKLDFGFNFKDIKNNLVKIKNDIIKIIKSWGVFVLSIGFKIADDVNIGAIITKVTDLLAAFTNLASEITDALIPAFDAFYDSGLSKLFVWLGSTALGGLQVLIDTFDDWSDWFKQNQDLIINFFDAFGRIFGSVWDVVSGNLDSLFDSLRGSFEVFTSRSQTNLSDWMQGIIRNVDTIQSNISNKVQTLFDVIGSKLDWLTDIIKKSIETLSTGKIPDGVTGGYEYFYNILLKIKQIIGALGGGLGVALGFGVPQDATDGTLTFYNIILDIKSIIQTLTPLVLDLVDAFTDFASKNILPFLDDKLQQLGSWLSKNRDNIKNTLSTVGNIAWTGFKVFVDLTGKLVDIVVKHPDAVIGFFSSLLALKVGSWFLGAAAGIGRMLPGLENLGGAIQTVGPDVAAGWSKFDGFASGLGTAISSGISTAAKTVGGEASTLLKPVTGAIWSVFSGVAGIVQTALTPVTGAIKTALAPVTGAIQTALGPVAGTISSILTPGVILVGVIVSLVAAFVDLWKTSNGFRQAFSGMAETIKSKVDNLTSKFGEGSKFSDAMKHLKSLYDKYLKPVLEVVFEIVGYLASGVLGVVLDAVSVLVDGLQQAFGGLINIVSGVLDLLVGLFTFDGEKIKNGLKQLGSGLLEIIQSIFGSLIGLLGSLISNLVDFILNSCKQIINKVKEVFGIHSPSTVFSDIGKNLILGLKDGVSGAWKSFSTFISNKLDGFKKQFKDFASQVGGFFGDVWSGITGGISTVYTTVTASTRASRAQRITAHANGGSIAGGQLFIANENGTPEMIGKISGSNKTNVANNQMITDAIFEAVYNAIAEASNQRASTTSNNNSTVGININGFGLIDQQTLAQLARLLAPYLGANNRNIANVNFSI